MSQSETKVVEYGQGKIRSHRVKEERSFDRENEKPLTSSHEVKWRVKQIQSGNFEEQGPAAADESIRNLELQKLPLDRCEALV